MKGSTRGHVAVVGAGIVGICTAAYLQRAGYAVTVIDRVGPGESCSFGNAGGMSPGSCVPVAMPGMVKQIPQWLTDPLGPLAIRWSYLLPVLPWLEVRAQDWAADCLIGTVDKDIPDLLLYMEPAGTFKKPSRPVQVTLGQPCGAVPRWRRGYLVAASRSQHSRELAAEFFVACRHARRT